MPLSLMVITLYLGRLAIHKLPPRELVRGARVCRVGLPGTACRARAYGQVCLLVMGQLHPGSPAFSVPDVLRCAVLCCRS